MITTQEKFNIKEDKLLLKCKYKYERKTFGKWFVCQVLKRTESKALRKVVAKCGQCSQFRLIEFGNIGTGVSTRCYDCNQFTHGMSESGTYNTWNAMRLRCSNPNRQDYARYGGLGIKVCERWKNSFESFLEDMGERPKKCTIDRIDPHGDYSKENCRWATTQEQHENKKNRLTATHNGVTKLLVEWCKILNLPYGILWTRVKKGQPIVKL